MELKPEPGPFVDPPRMDHKPASSMTIREHVWLTFAAAVAATVSPVEMLSGEVGDRADVLTADFEKRFGVEDYKEPNP